MSIQDDHIHIVAQIQPQYSVAEVAIMVLSIQTKKGRNLRCISLQYNKEETIEGKKSLRR